MSIQATIAAPRQPTCSTAVAFAAADGRLCPLDMLTAADFAVIESLGGEVQPLLSSWAESARRERQEPSLPLVWAKILATSGRTDSEDPLVVAVMRLQRRSASLRKERRQIAALQVEHAALAAERDALAQRVADLLAGRQSVQEVRDSYEERIHSLVDSYEKSMQRESDLRCMLRNAKAQLTAQTEELESLRKIAAPELKRREKAAKAKAKAKAKALADKIRSMDRSAPPKEAIALARSLAGCAGRSVPVVFVKGHKAVVKSGRAGYYLTQAGDVCQSPSAYRRAGGKPTRVESTESVTVGVGWLAAQV